MSHVGLEVLMVMVIKGFIPEETKLLFDVEMAVYFFHAVTLHSENGAKQKIQK
jgi:hypothetical protein